MFLMFNNAFIVHELANRLDGERDLSEAPNLRQRVASEPCLPERLPSSGFLQREAEHSAPKAILRQLRRSPTPPLTPTGDGDSEHEPETEPPQSQRRPSMSSIGSSTSSIKIFAKSLVKQKATSRSQGWREPQAFEVLRAVEQKDVMYLMEIRDRAFPLLLRKSGDVTPLLHAMRIGQSHRDVAIVLLGSFSRWINNLEDSEIVQPRTKVILKALRTNLKLAIDYGLAKSQSDLTASFLQTLVMSEGDKWIWAQVSNVSLALRAGTAGMPVKTANSIVRKFATKELGKAELIASLEDYVANATADLLMMGAWSIALDSIHGDNIPSYYFARDDRVYKAFVDRLDEHKAAIQRNLNKRLKWQLRVLRTALEGRTTTYRSKVELLAEELDEGDGV